MNIQEAQRLIDELEADEVCWMLGRDTILSPNEWIKRRDLKHRIDKHKADNFMKALAFLKNHSFCDVCEGAKLCPQEMDRRALVTELEEVK